MPALRIDDRLGEAWAVQGGLHYDSGDLTAAVADLSARLDDCSGRVPRR